MTDREDVVKVHLFIQSQYCEKIVFNIYMTYKYSETIKGSPVKVPSSIQWPLLKVECSH